MKSIDIDNLAVMFRVDDPNLGHVSTFEAMTELGLAYYFGLFMAIPKRHWRKRRQWAETIAAQLQQKSQQA